MIILDSLGIFFERRCPQEILAFGSVSLGFTCVSQVKMGLSGETSEQRVSGSFVFRIAPATVKRRIA